MSITVRLVAESSAPVGSSASSRAGRFASARAMATLCFCPPDNSLGSCFARSLMPTISSSSLARALRWRAGSPAYSMGSSTFFRALVRPIRLKVWNTKPIFWLRMAESCLSFAAATSTPSSA